VRIVIGYRALIALIATLIITFTRPDLAALALAVFAGFGFLHAIGSVVLGFTRKVQNRTVAVLPQAAVTLVASTVALLAIQTGSDFQIATLRTTVIAYLLLTATFEFYMAWLGNFKNVEAREHTIAASLATLFALIYLALNPEPLNAAGFLGAYFALSAVHQAVWAASPTKAD
jgi:hypothetical protein